MADIHDINIVDAKKFLLLNKAQLPANNNEIIYIMVKKLLERPNTNYKGAPANIVKWLLAYNVIQNGTYIPRYVKYEIYDLSLSERNKLAKLLGMKGNNAENIIDILRFLHKLDGDLDFANNDDLYQPLLLNSNFEQVISILEANPKLESLVKKLLQQIIENNIKYQKDCDINTCISDPKTQDFLDNLAKLNYIDILVNALTYLKQINYKLVSYDKYFSAFADNRILNKYYEINPYIFKRITRLEFFIKYVLADLKNKENIAKDIFYDLIYDTLTYAISINRYLLIEQMIRLWINKDTNIHKNVREFKYRKQANDKMNALIQEGRNIR
jgi:hypothetical protein